MFFTFDRNDAFSFFSNYEKQLNRITFMYANHNKRNTTHTFALNMYKNDQI